VPTASSSATQITAQSFALEGRIAVRYGEESLSGKFAWTHAPARDQLSLATPLGNQLAQIVRDGSGVLLTNSRQEQYRAPDVETLTEQQLGWRLPLLGLTDWVRGQSQSPQSAAVRDPQGRLTELKEAGWVIAYTYNGADTLPQRLILGYPRAEKPLEIRLVVDSWSAP
jgi:outer membrane lipoprotein LolB